MLLFLFSIINIALFYIFVKSKYKNLLTEYRKEDGMYVGHVFAETQEEAEKLAKQKGETVYGHIPPDCLDCEQELELRETI